jgi:hypothetical protein
MCGQGIGIDHFMTAAIVQRPVEMVYGDDHPDYCKWPTPQTPVEAPPICGQGIGIDHFMTAAIVQRHR